MLLKASAAAVVTYVAYLFVQLRRDTLTEFEKQAYMDVPYIIKSYGYPAEEHTVISHDGYILTLHRIPSGKINTATKGPILLRHKYVHSTVDFIIQGPEHSLAFLLADAGYDVWMENMRGNDYSSKHINLSANDSMYGMYTFHEILVNDTAVVIDYVLRHTQNSQLGFIGHSISGAAPFALTSELPEYNSKFKVVIGLAPKVYFPMKKLPALLLFKLRTLLYQFGFDLMSRQKVYADLSRVFCSDGQIFQPICMVIVSLATGSYEKNFNQTLLPLYFGHTPSGSSTHSDAHLLQVVTSSKLRRFDYGTQRNLEYYGSENPPSYNLANFNTKVALFCGTEDKIVACEGVERLFYALSHVKQKYFYSLEDVTHYDFVYSRHMRKQLYDRILEILETS